MRGQVVVTVSRGRVVWEGGQLNVTRGSGRFLPLLRFGPLFAGLEAQQRWEQSHAFPHGPVPVVRHVDLEKGGALPEAEECRSPE